MKKLSIIFATAILFSACSNVAEQPEEEEMMEDQEEMEMEEADEEEEESNEITADLLPVEGNDTSALGSVIAGFENGQYVLVASFDQLDELEEGYFYEGWIVRNEPLSVVSTGPLETMESDWVNFYSSAEDLTDHEKYILTLEPDDGDPAPAEHVLEGTFK